MKKLWFVLIVSVAGFGCGGDDSSDASTPKGKCYALASAYCGQGDQLRTLLWIAGQLRVDVRRRCVLREGDLGLDLVDQCLSTHGATCDKVTLVRAD